MLIDQIRRVRPAYDRVASQVRTFERRSRTFGRHTFVDRSQAESTLVVILAGYKQELWSAVFPALRRSCPVDADVCLVSAGKFDQELDSLAEQNSWSYLSTETNDVSLVQNLSIQYHPSADTIVKIDEDVFVTDETITDLVKYHVEVKKAGVVDPAFVAPTLNLNGFCYRDVLEHLGLLSEYEARFGTARISTRGISITEDADAAKWLWQNSGSVDRCAELFRVRDPSPRLAGVQFSIGLIVFERAFWESIGHLPVYWHRLALGKSTLGADEEYICKHAILEGRPMVVAPTIFAGHFSFGRQYGELISLLRSQPEIFLSSAGS